jgi:hypothetical protein
MQLHAAALGLAIMFAIGVMAPANAAPVAALSDPAFLVAQATVAPTGTGDAAKPMATNDLTAEGLAAEERMRRRFPQPVRVGDLIGVPVLDDSARTLGLVRQVVRTPQNKIELIVSYGGWFGWGARPVAVPIEVLGIAGRQLASLDMPRSEYAAAPTWQGGDVTPLSNDDSIRVALARH